MKSLRQVDILKGLAIIGVVFVHSVPAYLVKKGQFAFSLGQQVPIFIILSGLVMTLSSQNKEIFISKSNFKEEYITYFKSRIKRILPPIIITFIISSIIWFILDYSFKVRKMYGFGKLTFLGELPTAGPGTYYIGLLIQLTIIFPFIFYLYKKFPKITFISMFILNIIFEIYISKFQIFKVYHIYKICILRYFSALAIGMHLANDISIKSNKNRFILVLAPISAIYILFANNFNYQLPLFINVSWHNQNIGSVFYTALLVLIGLNYLPFITKTKEKLILEDFGKKSFHIFLAQILYFAIELSLFDNIMKNTIGIENDFLVYLIIFSIDFFLCYIGANILILIEKKFFEIIKRLENNNLKQISE